MPTYALMTRFGLVCAKVHHRDDGWLPVVVGQHGLPAPPCLGGRIARSEMEALQRLAEAIQRLDSCWG